MPAYPMTYLKNLLQAQLCYQFLITPLRIPLEKQYRDFAKLACEFNEGKRSEVIHAYYPRHHVIHHFKPKKNSNSKKVLIAHGWMSRAAYMIRLTLALQKQGYDVYALDFPAHGDSAGMQLTWIDAVSVLQETINQHGPFYAVIGHSFGGSMLLNTLNLAGQLPECKLESTPERAVLIASPTCMRSPVKSIAKSFKLSSSGYLQLRDLIRHQAPIDTKLVQLRKFVKREPETEFLCIHGELDATVSTRESIAFCNQYKNAQLALLPDADHVSVLMDERVDDLVSEFIN